MVGGARDETLSLRLKMAPKSLFLSVVFGPKSS